MVPVLLIPLEDFEPPSLNPQRLQQGFDGVLVIWFAGNGFAHQRGVVEAVRGILQSGARIKEQPGGPAVTAVPEDVFPSLAVGNAIAFGGDARGVVQKLFDLDLSLAGVAQGLSPWNVVKRRIFKCHPARQAAVLTLLRGNRKDSGANCFRAGRHVPGVGHRAVIAFDLQEDVTVPDDHGAERPLIRSQQPLLEFLELGGVHPAQATNVLRGGKLAPAALRFGRGEVIRRLLRQSLILALGFLGRLGPSDRARRQQRY